MESTFNLGKIEGKDANITILENTGTIILDTSGQNKNTCRFHQTGMLKKSTMGADLYPIGDSCETLINPELNIEIFSHESSKGYAIRYSLRTTEAENIELQKAEIIRQINNQHEKAKKFYDLLRFTHSDLEEKAKEMLEKAVKFEKNIYITFPIIRYR